MRVAYSILAFVLLFAVRPAVAQTWTFTQFVYAGDSLSAFALGPDAKVYGLLDPASKRDRLYLLSGAGGAELQPHLTPTTYTRPFPDYQPSGMLRSWPRDRDRVLLGRTGDVGDDTKLSQIVEVAICEPSGPVFPVSEITGGALPANFFRRVFARGGTDRMVAVSVDLTGAGRMRVLDIATGTPASAFLAAGGLAYTLVMGDVYETGESAYVVAGPNAGVEVRYFYADGAPGSAERPRGYVSQLASSTGSVELSKFQPQALSLAGRGRAVVFGTETGSQQVFRWDLELDRTSPSYGPQSNRATATGFVGADESLVGLESTVDHTTGAVYLAYGARRSSGATEVVVREVFWREAGGREVARLSIPGLAAVYHVETSNGELLVAARLQDGTTRLIRGAFPQNTLPRVSFPAALSDEVCFGESLPITVDYTGVAPGTALSYSFGCGPMQALDRRMSTPQALIVNCELAPGQCEDRELILSATSARDTVELQRSRMKVCGTIVRRDTLVRCGAAGFSTLPRPEFYKDTIAVSADCAETRLISYFTPQTYDQHFVMPCDTAGFSLKYGKVIRYLSDNYVYDDKGSPEGCPLTRRLLAVDNASLTFEISPDTLPLYEPVTIPDLGLPDVVYSWKWNTGQSTGRTVTPRLTGYYTARATRGICTFSTTLIADDGYRALGPELQGAPTPAEAPSLCGTAAFSATTRYVTAGDSEATCAGTSPTESRYYSFRSDASGALSFDVTHGGCSPERQDFIISLYRARVPSPARLSDLEGVGCTYTRRLGQPERATFGDLEPGALYFLRVATNARARLWSGCAFSLTNISGVAAGPGATPPPPTVAAPGGGPLVLADDCTVALAVDFDPALTDAVEVWIAGASHVVRAPGIARIPVRPHPDNHHSKCSTLAVTAFAIAGCGRSAAAPQTLSLRVCRPDVVQVRDTLCPREPRYVEGAPYYRGNVRVASRLACEPDTIVELVERDLLVLVNYDDRCVGDTLRPWIRRLSYEDTSKFSYVWSYEGVTGAAPVVGRNVIATQPGVYLLTTTDDRGCEMLAQRTVIDCDAPEVTTNGLTVKVWLPGGVVYDSVHWYVAGERVARGPGPNLRRYVLRGGDTLVYTLAQAGTYAIEATGWRGGVAVKTYETSVTVKVSNAPDLTAGKLRLEVYPNPVQTELTYRLSGARVAAGEPLGATAVDQLGRVVWRGTTAGGRNAVLPVGDWPAGTYYLRVRGANGVAQAMFVKRQPRRSSPPCLSSKSAGASSKTTPSARPSCAPSRPAAAAASCSCTAAATWPRTSVASSVLSPVWWTGAASPAPTTCAWPPWCTPGGSTSASSPNCTPPAGPPSGSAAPTAI